jgi:hypothetical protein
MQEVTVMNKPIYILLLAIILAPATAIETRAADGVLSPAEEADLVYIREEEKLARDTYLTLQGYWKENIFRNISRSEQRHMDAMERMLDLYGIPDPVVNNDVGAFTDVDIGALYDSLTARGRESLLEALHVGALIEEMDIADLQDAIDLTDEQPLINSYSNLLAGSRNHLRAFVSHITAQGVEYEAQWLNQSEVDAIVGDYDLPPPEGFSINPGLNDAWYYPETTGQGFVITVFPGRKTVFLAWFTFDIAPPDQNDTAYLGDAGQRWLTAQGTYEGAQAELEIGSMSGGIFDAEEPVPSRTPDGSILLQFEDCNSGSVFYDIPSIGRTGMIPIQRVNSENVAQCRQQGNGSGGNGSGPGG